MFSTVVNYIEGDIGGYPIPQYCKNNWQVPKYHVLNQQNTNTAFMIDHVCLIYLKHICTRNQPQPLLENEPQIDRYNDKKARLLDATTISW